MKKIVALILACVLCLGMCVSFTACSTEKNDFTVGMRIACAAIAEIRK